MIESMACGIPVAAIPSDAANTIIHNNINGYIHNDLTVAIKNSLTIEKEYCRMSVLKYNWENSTKVFLKELVNS